MNEQDTVRLLRECDAGVQMGVASIAEVLNRTHHASLRHRLADCKQSHEHLGAEIRDQLRRCHDAGKSPNAMARGMSWMKTNLLLAVQDSDHAVASLMTDGCNMGVKSLSRYLNAYKAADEDSKDVARRLIALESQLSHDLRAYL